LVFRKDYEEHKENPDELVDAEKRLLVGAGINTFDYKDRVPALVEAGADVLCIDSSDGYSEFQQDCLQYVKATFGERVKIGGGNVVDAEGFHYLADAGADFVKVGVGPGSICITREQKGIGRGQASAVLEVAAARDARLAETGEYIPVCSDGGIFHDYHIALALAMGADFVMMGRYFARFDESPAPRIRMGGNFVKEYWGEGTTRANNWERYEGEQVAANGSNGGGQSKRGRLLFEEGVDGYVPYAGKLRDNLRQTLAKIRATMCNCGVSTLEQLHRSARLTVVSATSLREGGIHDVAVKESDLTPGL
jgi:IMP dehydrogenase